jgi:hypothetical protein
MAEPGRVKVFLAQSSTFCRTPDPDNLKEGVNDLIGNYFEMYLKAPKYQFWNSR